MVRLTHTLSTLGLLQAEGARGSYRLGPRVLTLAYPMLTSLRVRTLARPLMQTLATQLGAAVSLGIPHRLGMVYVESAWHTDGRVWPPDTGTVMPLLRTAIGRAWLCAISPTERERALNLWRTHHPTAGTDANTVVQRALQQHAREGYCSSRDFRPEIEAVAVPFQAPIDGLRFVLNCGVLARSPLSPAALRDIGSALIDTVRALEASLQVT